MNLLQNQLAIVTGGTAGIGKAIALKFAEHGANVVIFGTNEERGRQVVQEIKTAGKKEDGAFFYKVDVSKTSEVDASIKEILGKHGVVDILVNNAGITRDQLLMKMSEEDWDEVMAINAKSCYNTCHALARAMLRAKKGSIINMSSVIGLTGNIGQANYAASKGAVIALTKSLAREFASRNVRVNGIAPGYIETKMTEALTEEQRCAIKEKIPLERLGSVEDIANAALFLASNLSSYITGQILTVDGGMVI